MAHIYRQNPNIDDSSKKYVKVGEEKGRKFRITSFIVLTFLFGLSLLPLWATGYFTEKRFMTFFLVYAALVVIFMLLSLLYKVTEGPSASDLAGLRGEDFAEYVLRQLPNTYTIFRNVHIAYDEGNSEIDNIIVGPTGVFIVEVKNQKGVVYADCNDNRWYLQKIGRGGTKYRGNDFYNPVKQVGTHIYRLANYVRDAGFKNVYVKGMVFFTNPECELMMENEKEGIPVYSLSNNGSHAVIGEIINNDTRIPQEEVEKICELIMQVGTWC